jgi:hypothetical protein
MLVDIDAEYIVESERIVRSNYDLSENMMVRSNPTITITYNCVIINILTITYKISNHTNSFFSSSSEYLLVCSDRCSSIAEHKYCSIGSLGLACTEEEK